MSVINTQHLVLYDKWPGPVNPNLGIPVNGWDSTQHHDVSIPAFQVGTKVMAYNDHTMNPGWYTMLYAKFAEGTDYAFDGQGDITAQGAGSGFCTQYEATDNQDGDGTAQWFLVTNDLTNGCATVAAAAGGGFNFTARVAVCAGDISGNFTSTGRNNYGWFWVGGVCPIKDLTNLHGDITTDGNVIQGSEVLLTDDGANGATIGTVDWTIATDGTAGPPNYSGAIIGCVWQTDA